MARIARPYLPGTIFHVTARTQGHAAWFTPDVRDSITAFMASAITGSDARLLAFAVMPNHLHSCCAAG